MARYSWRGGTRTPDLYCVILNAQVPPILAIHGMDLLLRDWK
ncbi:MAG TPA: hypothetical protein VMN99_06610 [Anaerolineales bacterium]|nr:hypothetical protein [Anaerolineales bacterium]